MTKFEEIGKPEQVEISTSEQPLLSPERDDGFHIHRFTEADLPRLGNWLYERLSVRHPMLNQMSFRGWLQGWMISNEHFFVAGLASAGLAVMIKDAMLPEPRVRVIFVCAETDEDMICQEPEFFIVLDGKMPA